jgi:adenylosuccinate synthase
MLTIVVGAQYGGEGKGKVCSALAYLSKIDISCRSGGVNSSHTVVFRSKQHRLRMLPAASVINPQTAIVYGAGSLIHISTLFKEIEELGIDPSLIRIDPNAGVVDDTTVMEQRADKRAKRCQRALKLAKDYEELSPFVSEVPTWLFHKLNNGADVLIEGHQGVGLSNYHGDYPYTSSRDCIASALLSEIGIGPRHEMNIVLAVKVFPTRNHGGNLPNEMKANSAKVLGISERGGGSWGISDNVRRVAGIDFDDIRRAVVLNQPNFLALTGIDYLNRSLQGKRSKSEVTIDISNFISAVENEVGVPVGLLSTGPEADSVIVWNTNCVVTSNMIQNQSD